MAAVGAAISKMQGGTCRRLLAPAAADGTVVVLISALQDAASNGEVYCEGGAFPTEMACAAERCCNWGPDGACYSAEPRI